MSSNSRTIRVEGIDPRRDRPGKALDDSSDVLCLDWDEFGPESVLAWIKGVYKTAAGQQQHDPLIATLYVVGSAKNSPRPSELAKIRRAGAYYHQSAGRNSEERLALLRQELVSQYEYAMRHRTPSADAGTASEDLRKEGKTADLTYYLYPPQVASEEYLNALWHRASGEGWSERDD